MLRVIDAGSAVDGHIITHNFELSSIAEDILSSGRIYCLKQCLSPEWLDTVRMKVFEYYKDKEQRSISYDTVSSELNYHAIERGVSVYQKTLHFFHAYIFNRIDLLENDLRTDIQRLFEALALLHSGLTGEVRSLMSRRGAIQYRPQLFHYPRGGGMFASHTHALLPQKIGIILGMSKAGRDYKDGGTGFELPDGCVVDTSSAQDLGDIILFRYDLKHWVYPCDIRKAVNVASPAGRWSAILPLF